MRKIILLAIIFFAGVTATAQDFSNKGKEFWLCFPAHVASGSSLAQFTIWITSDMASSGTVTLTNGAFSANFIVGANGLTSVSIPYSAAHISNAESFAVIQKSIRVKVNPGMPAVVAYAQQFGQARSAATLLLPTNVLGKKYYAVSFTQSGTGAAKSQFQIIATKPNTYVTITPRWNGVLQTPFTINFPNIGDIYQYQSDQDITGSYIESIASGSGGCNPIAVFSGSSALTMGTNSCTGGNSYDPLFQQAYPVTTWGKNFGFIPFGDYTNGNPYRIMASEDGTKVIINGSAVATLNAGEIYPPAFTSNPTVITQPSSISSDKPICVAQYAQKRDCSGTNNGDPDMVILNPIEQNISNITIFSSTQENINRQWINVLIKTTGVATFRINGAVPSTPFLPAPNIPGYSYLSHRFIPASSQSYLLSSDSGFNAIAYGFEQGQYESYAYSAGTNVKDLYQQIGVSTQYGIEPTPSVCTNTPFKFKVSLPYCADSIRWDLSFLPWIPVPPVTIDTIRYSTCTPGPGGPDSTTVVNGVTLYWYSLPTPYSFSTIGSFPVAITTYAPNSSGCGSEQLIDFNLQVSAPPLPGFTYTAGGCLAVPVQFTETTLQSPKPTYHWYWDFGDGNTSTGVRNPLHTYAAPGTYTVRYSSITTPGCLSDTVVQTVTVPDLPNATLSGTNLTACVNSAILPTITFTGSLGTPEYIFNYTIDNGSGPGPVLTSPISIGGVVTITHPTFAAGTFIYNIVSVRNVGTALCTRNITGQVVTVNILANHAVGLAAGSGPTTQAVCINNPIVSISYNLSGGATGATVSGLPAGVTYFVTGTTLNIIGSPNPVFAGGSAVYPYTVSTTGNSCLAATASGSITVNNDHTLSLNAGSTPTQTVCINSLIAPIAYTIGGGATGVTVTGLPAGVTYTVVGTTVTINGAPSTTVGSPFSYTINTTGNTCIPAPSLSGILTVNPNHAVGLAAGSGPTTQAVCINNPIVSISYNLSGGATGATVSGLPAGVTYSVTGTTLNIIGSPNPVFAGGSAVYPYTVSTTGNSCLAATASGSITVNNDHTLSLNAGSTPTQTVCINSLIAPIAYTIGGGATGVTVTGLPAGVTYTVVGTTVTINGAPSTTVGSPFSYTINTTGNTCIPAPSLSGILTVNPNHAVGLAAGSGPTTQAVCINNPIVSISYNLSGGATGATVSGLPAGVTYSVTGTTLNIIGSPNPVFAGGSAVYPYTVSTTGNSCLAATASGSITVNNDHTLSLNAGSTPTQTVCINSLIAPIAYTIGGGATGVTVTGLPAGVTYTVVGTTVTINGAPSTTVGSPFSYTINTTGNTCIPAPSLSGILTVNPNHAVGLAAGSGPTTQAVCINNPIVSISYNLSGGATGATVSGLPAGVTYSVTGTTLNIIGSPNPVFAGGSAVYPYTVSTTGNSCLAATASGSITVNNDHTLSLNAGSTPTQTVCINSLIAPIAYTIGGGATGVTVTGLPAGVTYTVVGTTVTINGAPSTAVGSPFAYTINTTGNACVPAAPLGGTISANPLPTALMSGDIEVCQNAAMPGITFTGTNATAPYTFTYSVNGGAPQTVSSIGVSSSATVLQSTAVANTFTYTLLSIQDGSSTACTQLQNGTAVVKVNPLPTAAISGARLVCINSAPPDITFTGAGGTAPYTFTYRVNAGTPQTISTTGSNTSVTLLVPTIAAGTFTYRLESVQDGSSTACIQAQTGDAVIVVSDTFPQPNFSIDKPSYCIPNAIVTFSNTSSIADGSLMTYLWNFGDGSANSTAFNPPPHWYGSMGPFNVILQAQSTATGCIHDTTIIINNIHPQPKADFTFNKPGICIGDNVTITDKSDGIDGAINQWNWNLGDGSIRTISSFTHIYTDTITYDVSLYSINTFGCNSDTLTKQFTVHPYPHVNAGPDRFILEGGTITLDPAVYANDAQYVWTPNLYLIDNKVAKVKVNKPLTDMTYRLTVTARGGCTLSDEVFIKLLKFPVIPNTFTPNNDGINDKWRIDYLNTYPDNRVQIFTRNGNLVFESKGYNTPWDGTLKGKPLPFDTYYYIIEPGNGRDPITGYVTILK